MDLLARARHKLFGGLAPDMNVLQSFVREVLSVADWNYDSDAAVKWGANFCFPVDVATRDVTLLSGCENNLTLAIKSLRQFNSQQRLNFQRVVDCVHPNDPDYDRIADLAVYGIRVHVASTFITNGTPPPLRQLYLQTKNAVNKMIYDLHQDNLLFILPLSYVLEHIPNIHFSPVHWAKKSGKACGRPIFDASDEKYGALNSEMASFLAEEFYGPIQHPTLTDIVAMILAYQDEKQMLFGDLYRQSQIILFKHDLKRAFMLLDFAPTDVSLLASPLTDSLVALYHTGLFGLGGMPFAFQVVTRVIQRHLNQPNILHGKICMYVDDIIGVSSTLFLPQDNNTVISYCEQLLGSQAIARDKSVHGRRLEAIGWVIDLDTETVSISNKNLLTFAFHLFNVDLNAKVSVQKLQQLASYSSRYSSILRCMKPFSQPLYGNFAGIVNQKALQRWHPDAVVAVQLWRIVLVHLRFNENTCARPLSTFRKQLPSHVITFDASLSGCGFIVREFVGATTEDGIVTVHDTGVVVSVGQLMFHQLPSPLRFGSDSKYQNTAEFIAVVFALACLKERGISNTGLVLRGDSATALVWSSTEKFKTLFARPAALVFLLLCLEEGLEISLTEHICAQRNTICDDLSRSVSMKSVCNTLRVDHFQVGVSLTKRVLSLVSFCDSELELNEFDEVISLWQQVKAAISSCI